METKTLINYTLDIVDITQFRTYLSENLLRFSTLSYNSFLKALDIPPKFFKEQPEETQEELLDNREIFVRETKKFFNKVLVVLKSSQGDILNVSRVDNKEAEVMYNKLKTMEDISNKFEHRSFVKDGFLSYIISEDIEKNKQNKVLVVDFPILLNKAPVIHKATYQIPDETFATPVEHIRYISSDNIDLNLDYSDLKSAIEDRLSFLTDETNAAVPQNILRETELVSLALVETGTIPKGYREKVNNHISENTTGELTTEKLESLVLDFDEELRSYKQVTNLREVSGFAVLRFLESDSFKELIKELDGDETEMELLHS